MHNFTIDEAKAAAKRLRARLSELGTKLSHTHALEASAAVLGDTDWNRFTARAQPASPPAQAATLISSRPGNGVLALLRLYDLSQCSNGVAIYCFPDMAPPQRLFPADYHVLVSSHALLAMDKHEVHALLQSCGKKVLVVHGAANFGSFAEALENTQHAVSAIKSGGLLKVASSLTLLDAQRWIHLKEAKALIGQLATLQRENVALRICSTAADDAETLAQHMPVSVLFTGPTAQQEMLANLSMGGLAAQLRPYPLELRVNAGCMRPVQGDMRSLEAWCSAAFSLASGSSPAAEALAVSPEAKAYLRALEEAP